MYAPCCQVPPAIHTNVFVDLNGMPYLLAEYLDRRMLQQIDTSVIKSVVRVDQSESMRAVIDISIDDIGKRLDTGKPNVMGNNSKQIALLNMINTNYARLDHQLSVLRRGIIIRVNYQLENNRTGQVLRSMVEDLRIDDRNYFLYINPMDINNNAIIVNFCSSMVSTINEFTRGSDPMILRITNIQLFYQCVRPNPMIPRVNQSMTGSPSIALPSGCGTEQDMYYYHMDMQNRHMMCDTNPCNCHNRENDTLTPPNWSMFNRFYRFENGGKDIIVHSQEVNDPRTKVVNLACGTVQINRAFMINPGHRIIYKFSVWKNDITLINDASAIAQSLRAPIPDPYYCNYGPHPMHPCPPCGTSTPCNPINPDYETLLDMYQSGKTMDYEQNAVINQLSDTVSELSAAVKELTGGGTSEDPDDPIPVLPELPSDEPPVDPPTNPDDPIGTIMTMLTSLQDQINELKGDDDNASVTPMPDQTIVNVVDSVLDETDPLDDETSNP